MEGFDWSRVITIVVGLVALIVGWAIGFFDSKMRADKKIQQAEERSELAIQQARGEAERAVMSAQAARAAAEAKPALAGTTLLRLWLDSSERPALDLDGQRVDTNPISEPNRKRLLTLITVMRPWIEGKSTAPAPTPPPSAPAMPRPTTTPAPIPAVAPAPAPVSKPVSPAAKEEKPATAVNIVAQIDEILQARLAHSSLANHAVRLTESPEGAVIVWVGLKKFAGVGEVPDPEVQAIIRAAIAEWEKKYTPG
ncbi:MAG: hypothetical protein ACOYZ6_06985 [Chloroflexota bacterium]